jgi:hypothetical protein
MRLGSREVRLEVVEATAGGDLDAVPERRRSISRRALFAGAGVLYGGVLIAGLPRLALSSPSAEQDSEVLNFVLDLERLQEAFYAEALASLKPGGEWGRFSRIVGGQERAHREFIEDALGNAAKPKPGLDFGNAFANDANYRAAAVAVEETAVAAYNGQATNLTPKTLAAAARIASVESRHASWARDLAGEEPAPAATDRAIGVKKATSELEQAGLER